MSGRGRARWACRFWGAVLAGMAAVASAQVPAPNAAVQKQLDQMMRNPQFQDMLNQAAAQGQAQAQTQKARPPAAARDPARLARVSRTPPSADALRQHIATVQAALVQRVPATQRLGTQQLMAGLKGQPGEPARTASQAWLMGLPELGLLLMGQASVDNPTDIDAQNNFAAFLTMLGGEPLAMPILLRLAADFPANATVLNNLGQAWYGLGDTAEAEKHLKAAVRILATHSQANQTLADIAEARGDASTAAAALKQALQSSYSAEKVARLQRTGALPDPLALPFHLPHPPDPLGLEQFSLPPFCAGVADSAACSARWQAFKAEIEDRSHRLSARLEAQKKGVREQVMPSKQLTANSSMAERMAAAQQIVAKVGLDHPPPLLGVVQPRFYEAQNRVGQLRATLNKETEPLQAQYRSTKSALGARLADIDKHYPLWGEGQPPGYEQQYCAEVTPVVDEASRKLNRLLEQMAAMGKPRVIKAYNDHVFYAQYVHNDTDFQFLKTQTQLQFLAWLASQHAEPLGGPRCAPPKAPAPTLAPLQDFYDLHCDNVVQFDSRVFGSFEVRCNKMTTRLNLTVPVAGLKIGFKGTMVDNLDTGEFVRGTAEIGASGGAKASVGPVEAGIGASGGGYIEMDGSGVTDVGLKGGASAGVGPLGASVDGRIGWNAGGSGTGKGTLGGFTVAGH